MKWRVRREDSSGGVFLPHVRGAVRLGVTPLVSPEEARAYALGILAAAMRAEDEREQDS